MNRGEFFCVCCSSSLRARLERVGFVLWGLFADQFGGGPDCWLDEISSASGDESPEALLGDFNQLTSLFVHSQKRGSERLMRRLIAKARAGLGNSRATDVAPPFATDQLPCAEAQTSWLPIPHTLHGWPGSRNAGVVVRRRGRAGIR